MHAVVRRYSGQGAGQLIDELERRRADVEQLIRSVAGFVSYELIRTPEGGLSVTVCQDRTGTEDSTRRAAEWVRANITFAANPPEVLQGDVIVHLS